MNQTVRAGLVKQRYKNDCLVACLAMLLNRTWEKALFLLNSEERGQLLLGQGLYTTTEVRIFGLLNIKYDIYPRGAIIQDNLDKGLWLLTVKSLNRENTLHAIVVKNGEIFDPSNEKTYTSLEDIRDAVTLGLRFGKSVQSNGDPWYQSYGDESSLDSDGNPQQYIIPSYKINRFADRIAVLEEQNTELRKAIGEIDV